MLSRRIPWNEGDLNVLGYIAFLSARKEPYVRSLRHGRPYADPPIIRTSLRLDSGVWVPQLLDSDDIRPMDVQGTWCCAATPQPWQPSGGQISWRSIFCLSCGDSGVTRRLEDQRCWLRRDKYSHAVFSSGGNIAMIGNSLGLFMFRRNLCCAGRALVGVRQHVTGEKAAPPPPKKRIRKKNCSVRINQPPQRP